MRNLGFHEIHEIHEFRKIITLFLLCKNRKMAPKLTWKRPNWTIFRRKGAPGRGESESRHEDGQKWPESLENRNFRFGEKSKNCPQNPKFREIRVPRGAML